MESLPVTTTLVALCLKAQDDNIHWMQEDESHLESKNSGNIENPSKKDSSKSSNSNNSPSKTSTNSSSNARSSSSSKPLKGSSKNKPKNLISDKLGKNGKLTGEECKHCMKEGLCLYCSEKGHVAHGCPRSAAAKAHAAKALALSLRPTLQTQKNSLQPSGICYMV